MPNFEKSLASPVKQASHAPASNTAAVVTIAAPNNGKTIFLTGVIFSADAAPAGARTATVAGGDATLSFYIPASAFAPIMVPFGSHPVKIAAGSDAVVTLPALGAGVNGSTVVLYYYGSA